MSVNMMLHLQTVPARNGLLWVRHAFKVWQRKPLAVTGLYAFIWLTSTLVLLFVPVVGPFVVIAAAPLISLGFMLSTHLILQSQTPTVAVFLAPLKLTAERRKTQLAVCIAYLGATLALGTLVYLFNAELLAQSAKALSDQLAKTEPDTKAIQEIFRTLIFSPIGFWGPLGFLALCIPFWHTAALVHWGGQGLMQALFSSTLGIVRNFGAFALYGLGWLGVWGVMYLFSLVLPEFIMIPLALIPPSLFYASLYFTFIDCFMFGAPRDLLSK